MSSELNGAVTSSPGRLPEVKGTGRKSVGLNGAVAKTSRASNGSPVRTTQCCVCKQANSPDRKFCADCGASLWFTCESCGVACTIDEKFCGACGANVREAQQERIAACEAKLSEARRAAEQGYYQGATVILELLAAQNDLLVAQFVNQAQQMLAKLGDEQATRSSAAAAAFERARASFDTFAYEAAEQALADVPPGLLSEEMRELRDNATARYRETRTLREEIRTAVKERQTLELMPKLQRLIELEPADNRMRRLAEQLRDRLCEAAQQRTGQFQYAAALELLRKIAPAVVTDQTRALTNKAAELAWLSSDLRGQPLATPMLLEVAQRLLKHLPDDKRARELAEHLQKRLAAPVKDPRQIASPWDTSPQRWPFGAPVTWLANSSRLAGWEAAVARPQAEHAGCFFVACGLALEGLERAAIRTNLLPAEKKSLFNFRLARRRTTPAAAWGLDFGGSSLKAVRLACDDEQQPVRVEACERIEYSRNLKFATNEDQRFAVLKQALEALAARHDLKSAKLCVSLRGSHVLARYFQAPPIDDKKLPDLIAFQVQGQIPCPIDQLFWDYHISGQSKQPSDDKNAEPPRRSIMILAARNFHVQERLDLFQKFELEVGLVQSETVALHNFAVHEFFPSEDEACGDARATACSSRATACSQAVPRAASIALLDVGSDTSNVVVSTPNAVWFRNIVCGGNHFSEALIDQHQCSFTDAEQITHRPGRARRISRVYAAYQPVFGRLFGELERSFGAMARDSDMPAFEQIYCLGGGTHLHGLLRCLRSGPEAMQV